MNFSTAGKLLNEFSSLKLSTMNQGRDGSARMQFLSLEDMEISHINFTAEWRRELLVRLQGPHCWTELPVVVNATCFQPSLRLEKIKFCIKDMVKILKI